MIKRPKLLAFFFGLIFLVGYSLRVLYLPELSLTFGYDQARDAYITQQIINGDWKILGPPASTPGLYHGVFYYYLLAPAYFLGKGSPLVAAYWIAFLNALTIFIVSYLTFLLTRKIGAALLSGFLFAIAFEATQYAVWLSNPTIGVWTVPLVYLGLWAWIKERKSWGPLLTGLGLGLSIQAEIFLAYHVPPVILWLWIARKNIKRSQIMLSFLVLLLSLSTMILAEIKFGYRSLSGIFQLAVASDPIALSRGLGDFILLYLNQLGRVFAYSSYPGNLGYGGVLVLAILGVALFSWNKKSINWQPFLATWLLSHITVVSVGGTSTPFLLVGIGPAVAILLGITFYNWWRSGSKVLTAALLLIITFGNMAMIAKENLKGQTIFAIQKDMVLKKQLAAIDYTYQEAKGDPFSTNSLTSPLWINIVWSYLYKWYGFSKYGYVPEWHGRDQIGQLDTLPSTSQETSLYFLILEPMGGIPQRYLPETVAEEDARSELVDEKYFGELIVQKRIRKEVEK